MKQHEDTLKQISNYKYNNELLDKIIVNKHLCEHGEIELIRDLILSNNLNFHTTKIKLANDQKWLMNKNISSVFLANNFQLELTIKNFAINFIVKVFKMKKKWLIIEEINF
ncbi:hypothetical protein [Spiroplasma endosymbiont of Polydrusus pterygomalis]|uniref:hypothetical protein n=1 Tax=Spiroplasma endosymbiont of Polydrusus pterygomalis TaxID=3139327 RepID=UPI003CCAAE22